MRARPSTYTPFTRWFSNEREREFDETRRLHGWLQSAASQLSETPDTIGERIFGDYVRIAPDAAVSPLTRALARVLALEAFLRETPEADLSRLSAQEFVEYRNLLLAKQHFFANQAAILHRLEASLRAIFCGIAYQLPEVETPSPFSVPLIYTLQKPRLLVEQVYGTICSEEVQECGLFGELAEQFARNVYRASGIDRGAWDGRRRLVQASESTLPLEEMVQSYCGWTPFYDLFLAPMPLKLGRQERFSHMHVCGGTGAGKTTLLEKLIEHDLESDDPPSMVIIDPHGDMLQRLLRADLGIEDRLIYVDPRDTAHPPALNIFALNQRRMASYDEATREQVMAGTIQTLEFLFNGLGADTTAKQNVPLRYLIRLLLSFPETMGRNATILDMMRLLKDPAPYAAAMDALPPLARDFFAYDFGESTFRQTREQLRYRLQAILQNPLMERLLTAPDSKIDLFEELNRGAIILVDTAKSFLKDGSGHFGRFVVSLVFQAIMERAAIPEHARKDTFLYIDEAGDYISGTSQDINDILNEARKYRAGLVLAHHYLGEAHVGLQSSLMTNTASKFVSQVSARDAGVFAKEMRCDPDFILDQPKLHFAAHIRGVTPHAITIPIEPRRSLPQLDHWQYEELIETNRARVSLGRSIAATAPIEEIETGSASREAPENWSEW